MVVVDWPNEIIHQLLLSVHLPVLLGLFYLGIGAFDHSLELVDSFVDSINKVVFVEEVEQCIICFDILMDFKILFTISFCSSRRTSRRSSSRGTSIDFDCRKFCRSNLVLNRFEHLLVLGIHYFLEQLVGSFRHRTNELVAINAWHAFDEFY